MKQIVVVLLVSIVLFPTAIIRGETFESHCRDYPPELFIVDTGCKGVLPDLVTDIFNELGHDIVWKNVPWQRSLKEAELGRVDLLIRHSMIEERRTFLHPIEYSRQARKVSFFLSPYYKSDIIAYDDLKKIKIGAIRGNFYSPKFAALNSENITEVETTEQLIGMLERGRIDAVVSSKSHSIDMFKTRFKKASFDDIFYNPMYISIPKRSKASKLYQEINKLMQEYRTSGRINTYFQKYGATIPDQNTDK